MAGEYTAAAMLKGVLRFVEQYAPQLIDRPQLPLAARPVTAGSKPFPRAGRRQRGARRARRPFAPAAPSARSSPR